MKTSQRVSFVIGWAIFTAVLHFVNPVAEAADAKVTQLRELIPLQDGRKIWVEADIIDPRLTTKIIFNGLTNSASNSFHLLSDALLKENYNVIRFDFPGQGKTLLANLPLTGEKLTISDQADVVHELIPTMVNHYSLSGGLEILGQSYGGGVILRTFAKYPEFSKDTFRAATEFSSYTEPLAAQDEQIKQQVELRKMVQANSHKTDDQLYDEVFYQTVMSTYWIAEPEIIGKNLQETRLFLQGVYHLAQGIRTWKAEDDIGNLPDMPINLVMSMTDQYIPSDVIPRYWNSLPLKNRGYLIKVYGSEHKIFQAVPRFAAAIEAITSHPFASSGHGSEFNAFVVTNRIQFTGNGLKAPSAKEGLAMDIKNYRNSELNGLTTNMCRSLFAHPRAL